MKKLFTLSLLVAGIAYSANAQLKISGTNPVPVNNIQKHSSAPSPLVIDTLMPSSIGSPCDTGWVYYSVDAVSPNDSGYAFGNNVYGETECAQRYLTSGNVQQVLVLYGKVAGTTGSTTVKIYSVNASTKKPQTVLGTSTPILTGALTTTTYVAYSFSSPVTVTNEFSAAVVFPTTAGDTVAVASTLMGCFSNDSLSWENFPAFGGWYSTPMAFSYPYNPNMNLDLIIFPVVDVSIGLNEYPSSGSLTLLGAYPNPASDFTNIRYRTDEPSEVSVRVFDISGRGIKESTEKLNAGVHELKVNVKLLPAGNYYYTIKTGSGILTSKFTVE